MENYFLLEVGVEELPSRFVSSTLDQIKSNLTKMFNENRIEFSDIKTYGTPRRLTFIVENISEGKPIEMFLEHLKTPLDFDTLTNLILKLMENFTPEIPKCINVSGDDVLSKYDIGLMIAKKYKCDEKLIVPISMDSDNKIFSEKRANCTLLDNSLLKKTLGISEIKIGFRRENE